jgi:hypothetical protein
VLSVSRTVVAHGTSKEQRTRYISILDACRFIGYSVTCAIGWALGYVNITVRGFVLDGLTAPGFFLVLVNAGLMLYSRLVLRRRIREAGDVRAASLSAPVRAPRRSNAPGG